MFNSYTGFTSPRLTEVHISHEETSGCLNNLKEEVYSGDRADV